LFASLFNIFCFLNIKNQYAIFVPELKQLIKIVALNAIDLSIYHIFSDKCRFSTNLIVFDVTSTLIGNTGDSF